jgi:arginase family enzyme
LTFLRLSGPNLATAVMKALPRRFQEGLIDPDASILIGIRTPSPPSPKLHVLTANRCLRMDGKAIAETIVDVVGTRKCYVTLDVDVMDPAYASGTGTPAPGGLTSALQREILWQLKGCHTNACTPEASVTSCQARSAARSV